MLIIIVDISVNKMNKAFKNRCVIINSTFF